jgi:hypothetical protein
VNKSLAKVPVNKFEPIAAQLGAAGVDWAIDRLRRYERIVGGHIESGDDFSDRLAYESALYLERWLRFETKGYEKIGEDHPTLIEDVSTGLHELLPLIKEYIPPTKERRTNA